MQDSSNPTLEEVRNALGRARRPSHSILPRSRAEQSLRASLDPARTNLQGGGYDSRQCRADTQLIRDSTYFVAEHEGDIVGCGGWSYRAALVGGDKLGGRDANELDPRTQPARIRAFFVDPGHARKGIGRMLLQRCELEALKAHFSMLKLMASLSSTQLYAAHGYISEKPRGAGRPRAEASHLRLGVLGRCPHPSRARPRQCLFLGPRTSAPASRRPRH